MQARIYEFFTTKNDIEMLVVADTKEAELARNAAEFAGWATFVLPDFRAQKGDDLNSFSEELMQISHVLNGFYNAKQKYQNSTSQKNVKQSTNRAPKSETKSETKTADVNLTNERNLKKAPLLIAPVSTILHKLPSPSNLQTLTIKKGDELNLTTLKEKLLNFGYTFTDIVVESGEVRFGGDMLDIFVIGATNPLRILSDFDVVESIREFDAATQKSIVGELDAVEVVPFLSALATSERENLEKEKSLISNLRAFGFWEMAGFVDLTQTLNTIATAKFDNIFEDLRENTTATNATNLNLQPQNQRPNFRALPPASRYKTLNTTLSNELCEANAAKKICVLSSNEAAFRALNIRAKNVQLILTPLIVNLVSPETIIISLNQPQKLKRKKRSSIVLDELKAGELVVHEEHGVGKFLGLELTKVLGIKRELIAIGYANGDKLLLPVEHLNVIERYIAGSGVVGTLDKLGKATFAKVKEKVRQKLFEIALKIAGMAAQRELVEGAHIALSDGDLLAFQHSAGFVYTQDQESAVEEILLDLKSGRAMDRLLSGDVGFGKTEVAMNAIYACVKSGFQALFFAPTTLLVSQHFLTLKKRLGEFGVEVLRLDRFSTPNAKRNLSEALVSKRPLCVVGTHALLGVAAPALGLVVVDEEHKFGVKQKEKLKAMGANSHILSMSATPIPRSLNMALSGIKSYSSLVTPPLERLSVRSYVREWDESVVKEAILRELRRGGQVIFVHNRIADLQSVERELVGLLPNLRVLILHGKVDLATSEEEMERFVAREYDLLLCTSIVENGIDFEHVNTILVNGSDRFGLADLHQLRGRVGRRDKQGYCYFFVENVEALTDDARSRLSALESNSFLGSGAILARHDLEIRGGGNILGEAQSGHIEAIGYSLYLKMLEDALNLLLNKKSTPSGKNVEMKLAVNAFLNAELIDQERIRLELYRRLSQCESTADVFEIAGEIEDRFGRLDVYTKQFLDVMMIKIMAFSNGFVAVSSAGQSVVLVRESGEKVVLKARSSDEDDVLAEALVYLRRLGRG